jgi:hypothetical protein
MEERFCDRCWNFFENCDCLWTRDTKGRDEINRDGDDEDHDDDDDDNEGSVGDTPGNPQEGGGGAGGGGKPPGGGGRPPRPSIPPGVNPPGTNSHRHNIFGGGGGTTPYVPPGGVWRLPPGKDGYPPGTYNPPPYNINYNGLLPPVPYTGPKGEGPYSSSNLPPPEFIISTDNQTYIYTRNSPRTKYFTTGKFVTNPWPMLPPGHARPWTDGVMSSEFKDWYDNEFTPWFQGLNSEDQRKFDVHCVEESPSDIPGDTRYGWKMVREVNGVVTGFTFPVPPTQQMIDHPELFFTLTGDGGSHWGLWQSDLERSGMARSAMRTLKRGVTQYENAPNYVHILPFEGNPWEDNLQFLPSDSEDDDIIVCPKNVSPPGPPPDDPPVDSVFNFSLSEQNVTWGVAGLPYESIYTPTQIGIRSYYRRRSVVETEMPVFEYEYHLQSVDVQTLKFELYAAPQGSGSQHPIRIGVLCFCESEADFVERQIVWDTPYPSRFVMNGQVIADYPPGGYTPIYRYTPNIVGLSMHVIEVIENQYHTATWTASIATHNTLWPSNRFDYVQNPNLYDFGTGVAFNYSALWHLAYDQNVSIIDQLVCDQVEEDPNGWNFARMTAYAGHLRIDQYGGNWRVPDIDRGNVHTTWAIQWCQFHDHVTGLPLAISQLGVTRLRVGMYSTKFQNSSGNACTYVGKVLLNTFA